MWHFDPKSGQQIFVKQEKFFDHALQSVTDFLTLKNPFEKATYLDNRFWFAVEIIFDRCCNFSNLLKLIPQSFAESNNSIPE